MDRKRIRSGRYSYFQDLAGKLVTLRINSKSTPRARGNRREGRKQRGGAALSRLDGRKPAQVAEATGGRIGYMHVPDTSFPHHRFDKQLTRPTRQGRRHRCRALQLRGQIQILYEKLRRELLAALAPRERKRTFLGPRGDLRTKRMIVNEPGQVRR